MRRVSAVALLLICAARATGLGQAQTAGLNAAQLFDKGMNALSGSGVTQSGTDAVEYFRRSADLGYVPAEVALGYFYETGKFTAKEPGQALSWYRKAAQQDDPLAEWLAGRIIYAGLVAPRDLNEARGLFQSSANHRDAFGQYLLGRVQLDRQDYSNAAGSFRKAAEQGLPQAQEQLAKLLRDGQGVAQDKFAAYVWMLVSQDAGNRRIATDLQALEAGLGSSQVEQAKTKARELEGSVTRSVSAHGCTGWPGEFDAIPAPPPPDLQRFCR